MGVTTTNLLQGPAVLYSGIVGATEPLDTALNTVPGTGWTDLGGTMGGLTFSTGTTLTQLDVDQVLDVVGDVITARAITLATSLAEATLANLALAMNLAPTTVVTGATPAGPTLEPVSDVTSFTPFYRAFLMDGIAPGGFKRRVIIRRAIQTASSALPHSPTAQTVIPVTFGARYVSPSIKPVRWVDGIA